MCIWSPMTGRHWPATRLLSPLHVLSVMTKQGHILRKQPSIYDTFHILSLSSVISFSLAFCSEFKVMNLLRSALHNAADWALEHTSDWQSLAGSVSHILTACCEQAAFLFFFLPAPVMSIKQVVSYPLVRRSHTEWQVFLPRSHPTANPLLPCATWSFQANHGGGSKTSPCLQLCDSQVSRAPCCCSGNSKGGCWGFRVPWDERRIPPRTLGQWWGAASHENLGQFCLFKLLLQSSCNRSQSAQGVKSCICLVPLFLSSSLFILFLFFTSCFILLTWFE